MSSLTYLQQSYILKNLRNKSLRLCNRVTVPRPKMQARIKVIGREPHLSIVQACRTLPVNRGPYSLASHNECGLPAVTAVD